LDQDKGGGEFQAAGILEVVEDLKLHSNTDIGIEFFFRWLVVYFGGIKK
jgi:hypothetical protein